MDQILPLSTYQHPPVPVERQGKAAQAPSRQQGQSARSPEPAGQHEEREEPIAPYQALPVSGTTITHNITPALPVIEESELSQEVGG